MQLGPTRHSPIEICAFREVWKERYESAAAARLAVLQTDVYVDVGAKELRQCCFVCYKSLAYVCERPIFFVFLLGGPTRL